MDTINVLIINDDPTMLSSLLLDINRKNESKKLPSFNVIGATKSGRKAVLLIKKHTPTLTLLDILLPDISGLQILQEIRFNQIPTDIIIITEVKDINSYQQALRFGIFDYIIKPFKFHRFEICLNTYKNYWNILKKTEITQNDIDIIYYRTQTNKELIPKGINHSTLDQILLYLKKQKNKLSAEEIASGTGLAKATVWRYLEYLTNKGLIKIELHYGSIGRPIKKYKL